MAAAKRNCKACGKSGTDHSAARLCRDGKYTVVGYYCKGKHERARERDMALARLRRDEEDQKASTPQAERITGAELVADYLAEYAEQHKASSLDTARQSLKAFTAKFGKRPIGSIDRDEAKAWAKTVPVGTAIRATTLFNWAIDEEKGIAINPFRRLGQKGNGRADNPPPTVEELEALRDACDVLGDYAPRMRDLIDFAGYTLMRPSELYAVRHTDADLARNRLTVSRRLYRGRLDVPKSGKPKTIALVPPAMEILLRQPTRTRDDGLVFVGMQGKPLNASTLCGMWTRVKDRAGLDFVFYEASKHLGVHRLYKLGLSKRAIAAQAGWSEESVDAMLRVYGHMDLVALSEVDALYENVTPLRTT